MIDQDPRYFLRKTVLSGDIDDDGHLEVESLSTNETDTALRLAPDGLGGVAWQPGSGTLTTLTELGLPSMTTAERDELDPSDGWVIWNEDDLEMQIYRSGTWETVVIEPVMQAMFDLLAYRIGQIRTALRFLDIELDQFEPET